MEFKISVGDFLLAVVLGCLIACLCCIWKTCKNRAHPSTVTPSESGGSETSESGA